MFGYSLSLTEEENQAVEKRLAEIDQLLEPWDPPRRLLEDGQPTYAYKLKYDLGLSYINLLLRVLNLTLFCLLIAAC